MTVSPPTTPYPVSPSYTQIGREPAPATVATAFATVKTGVLKPMNKPTWLKDDTLWGDMNKEHDKQMGPLWGEIDFPEAAVYGDTIGHFLFNLFGDYTTTGTASTPTWTTSGSLAAGATSITVTTGTAATAGTFIQVDTGVNSEVVTVGTGSTTTSIVLSASTPLRFSHATSIAVVTVIAPFTHTFSTLNPGGTTANAAGCQPPTHTIVHHNTPAGPGSFNADQFNYGCLSEVTLTGKANGWLTWSAKATCYGQVAPAAAITSQLTQVKGIPAWKSTNTIAGSLVNNVAMWTATWTREMEVVNTADGVQAPYFIGRGEMTSKFKLTFNPATDESQLNHMLANDQPSLAWAVSNGGSGASLISLAANSQLAGYENAPLTPVSKFWGYDVEGSFVASTTGAGNSGGTTYSQLVLVNNIPTY